MRICVVTAVIALLAWASAFIPGAYAEEAPNAWVLKDVQVEKKGKDSKTARGSYIKEYRYSHSPNSATYTKKIWKIAAHAGTPTDRLDHHGVALGQWETPPTRLQAGEPITMRAWATLTLPVPGQGQPFQLKVTGKGVRVDIAEQDPKNRGHVGVNAKTTRSRATLRLTPVSGHRGELEIAVHTDASVARYLYAPARAERRPPAPTLSPPGRTVNRPPVIHRIEMEPKSPTVDDRVAFTVHVSDPDGDPLKCELYFLGRDGSRRVENYSLAPRQQRFTRYWTMPPAGRGNRFVVKVRDGRVRAQGRDEDAVDFDVESPVARVLAVTGEVSVRRRLAHLDKVRTPNLYRGDKIVLRGLGSSGRIVSTIDIEWPGAGVRGRAILDGREGGSALDESFVIGATRSGSGWPDDPLFTWAADQASGALKDRARDAAGIPSSEWLLARTLSAGRAANSIAAGAARTFSRGVFVVLSSPGRAGSNRLVRLNLQSAVLLRRQAAGFDVFVLEGAPSLQAEGEHRASPVPPGSWSRIREGRYTAPRPFDDAQVRADWSGLLPVGTPTRDKPPNREESDLDGAMAFADLTIRTTRAGFFKATTPDGRTAAYDAEDAPTRRRSALAELETLVGSVLRERGRGEPVFLAARLRPETRLRHLAPVLQAVARAGVRAVAVLGEDAVTFEHLLLEPANQQSAALGGGVQVSIHRAAEDTDPVRMHAALGLKPSDGTPYRRARLRGAATRVEAARILAELTRGEPYLVATIRLRNAEAPHATYQDLSRLQSALTAAGIPVTVLP